MITKLTPKLRWYILKHKIVKFVGLHYCDWCDSVCYNPLDTEHEMVCKSCQADTTPCECCQEIVHPEDSVDMPEGWYCRDCWDSVYG